MSIIDGIKLPNGNTYNVTLPLLSSGFTTTAGSSTSGAYLAAKWAVANVNGITTPVDGMTIAVRVPLAGNSGGVLLSIDGGTTYYPVVRNVNTLVTTNYAVGSTIVVTFNSTQTASPYLTAGTTTSVKGCWQIADYDANTKNSAGTSEKTATKLYLVGATSQSSSGVTTYSNKLCYVGTDNCLYSNGTKVLTSDADTKNTAGSTNSSKKLFLIGAESQAANPQTYSHNTAYVGTDGCLYSNSTKVSVDGHTHSYAGSSSAGGAANRVANQLTMYIGGTNSIEQKVYDGSEAIEINVASSGHEHDDYAPKASPTFTGTPKAPTAAAGTNTTQIATTAFVTTAVANNAIVTTAGTGAAYTATVPGITALTAGVSFVMVPNVVSTSTTPTLNVNSLGAKQIRRRLSTISTSAQAGYTASWLAVGKPFRVTYDGSYWIAEGLEKPVSADLYGSVPVDKGGTGATTAEAALTNLGVSDFVQNILDSRSAINWVLVADNTYSNISTQSGSSWCATSFNFSGRPVMVKEVVTVYSGSTFSVKTTNTFTFGALGAVSITQTGTDSYQTYTLSKDITTTECRIVEDKKFDMSGNFNGWNISNSNFTISGEGSANISSMIGDGSGYAYCKAVTFRSQIYFAYDV